MRKVLGVLLSVISIVTIFGGCKEQPSYMYHKYSEEQIIHLVSQNEKLFNEMVRVLIEDDDFFEEGRRTDAGDAFINSDYDENIELLDNYGQQVVCDFFELKPYLINFDNSGDFIEITFIGDCETIESFVFVYWIDQEDVQGAQKYLSYRQTNGSIIYPTLSLPAGWRMYYHCA